MWRRGSFIYTVYISLWTIWVGYRTGLLATDYSIIIYLHERYLFDNSLYTHSSRRVVQPEQATWKVFTPEGGGLLRCPRTGAATTNFCAAQRLTTMALRARGSRLRDGKSWRMPRLKIRAPIYARGCVFISDTATDPTPEVSEVSSPGQCYLYLWYK